MLRMDLFLYRSCVVCGRLGVGRSWHWVCPRGCLQAMKYEDFSSDEMGMMQLD